MRADPDLELRGGGRGVDLLALLALLPYVISSFLPKIRGVAYRAPPLDPPPAMECIRSWVDHGFLHAVNLLIHQFALNNGILR